MSSLKKEEGKNMEEKIKETLFGKINPRSRKTLAGSGGLTLKDLEKLKAPLLGEEEKEVINIFCTGHHGVYPISLAGRTELTRLSGAEIPVDWTGKYFEVSCCPFCSEDMHFHDPILKDFQM